MLDVVGAVLGHEEDFLQKSLGAVVADVEGSVDGIAELDGKLPFGGDVVAEAGPDAVGALRLVLKAGQFGLMNRVARGNAAQRRHPLGRRVEVTVHFLVVLLQEQVKVVELRTFNEPVVLVVLVIQHPERGLQRVQPGQQFLDGFTLQPDGVFLDLRRYAPGLAEVGCFTFHPHFASVVRVVMPVGGIGDFRGGFHISFSLCLECVMHLRRGAVAVGSLAPT